MTEDFFVGHEMDFCATSFRIADDAKRRNLDAVLNFDQAINHTSTIEIELIFLAVTPNRQTKPF